MVAIGILVIVALTGLAIVQVVRQTTAQALQPVGDLTGNLNELVGQVRSPTPTIIPDPLTIVRQVRTLSRLETIQYSVEKVITAEIGQGAFSFLFGDRLLLVAHGQVIAGVDLGKMGPQDLWFEDDRLFVRLPEPEIFITALDNEKSYVYDRSTGVLSKGEIDLETVARRAAEREIENAALEDGILEQARRNAESYLFTLFHDLGYSEVIFVEATPIE